LYILEALANGVPVVQPAHGAFPELVEATGGGLLVPPGDAEALAEGLARLKRDAALRTSLGSAGRRAVEERFSLSALAERTVEIVGRAVAPQK
jgi:glycosyltransferase involved in cell wall biosynthesis